MPVASHVNLSFSQEFLAVLPWRELTWTDMDCYGHYGQKRGKTNRTNQTGPFYQGNAIPQLTPDY